MTIANVIVALILDLQILEKVYLAHVIEQPIFRIPNILFVYFFIVIHIFFEARLERVIDGVADYWSYFRSSKE